MSKLIDHECGNIYSEVYFEKVIAVFKILQGHGSYETYEESFFSSMGKEILVYLAKSVRYTKKKKCDVLHSERNLQIHFLNYCCLSTYLHG
jgi:hypothetical protein